MNHRRLWVALSLALTAGLVVEVSAAKKSRSASRFESKIEAFEAADKENPPPQGAILITGASNVVRWKSFQEDLADYTVLNRGFGGSQIADIAYYADRVIIPYHPAMVIVQAGGNDLKSGKTPEEVLNDAKQLVEKIRTALPDTRIAFLSINPSPARWEMRQTQSELNKLLKSLLKSDENFDFIDIDRAFLTEDDKPRTELFADGQHHNEAGFKARAAIILQHLPPKSE